MLLEDIKHFILSGDFAQLIRILKRRNTQQHTVIILLQPEKIKFRSIGKECTIIIIHVITYFIIGSIDRAGSLQEFHLLHISLFLEECNSILGRHHISADRHVGIDNFLHTITQLPHHLLGKFLTQTHIHIKSIGNRDVDNHIRTGRENILHRLAEHKEKRTGIGPGT